MFWNKKIYEYKVIVINAFHINYTINLENLLNQMSEKGWEVTSTPQLSSLGRLIFRRIKHER